MTGAAADPPEWQQHIRNKARREALAKRFRDVGDPFGIVLVRDMARSAGRGPEAGSVRSRHRHVGPPADGLEEVDGSAGWSARHR